MASGAENVSIWWRHHDIVINVCLTVVEIFNVLSLTKVSFEILREMAQREALVFWAKYIIIFPDICVLLLRSITCLNYVFIFEIVNSFSISIISVINTFLKMIALLSPHVFKGYAFCYLMAATHDARRKRIHTVVGARERVSMETATVNANSSHDVILIEDPNVFALDSRTNCAVRSLRHRDVNKRTVIQHINLFKDLRPSYSSSTTGMFVISQSEERFLILVILTRIYISQFAGNTLFHIVWAIKIFKYHFSSKIFNLPNLHTLVYTIWRTNAL